jgi:hypothetical protein
MAMKMENMNGQQPADRRVGSRGFEWRTTAGLVAFSLLLPLVLFGAAGRLHWGMGWLYVGIAYAVTLVTRLLILRVDPGLIAERAGSLDRSDLRATGRTAST